MKYGITFGISALLLSTFSSQTLAHFPLMSCHIAQQKVLCEAGYSDGSTGKLSHPSVTSDPGAYPQ